MRRFIFFQCIIFFLWPVPAFASNITLEYWIGLGDRYQLGKWTPVTILIENRGRTINGTLKLVNTSGSEYRGDVYGITHTMEVDLPANSRKRFSFTIPLKSFSHPLLIQLLEEGNIIETKSINLRPYYVEKGLGVMVTEKISTTGLPLLPDALHPVITRPQLLPESWYGYDGVVMLIMHAHILETLRDRQYLALKEWIKNGGCTIISGGQNSTALLGKRISDLLPMIVSGFERMTDLISMEGFAGRPLIGKDPFLVLRATVKDSTVLMMEKNIPIITLKDVHLGKVIFIAFDYQANPFAVWDGWNRFWARLFMLTQDPAITKTHLDIQRISQGLVSAIPARFPNINLSLVIGFIYLLLVSVFFKRIGKARGIAPGTIILSYTAIGIFSFAVIWFFFLRSPQRPSTYNSFSYINKKGMHSAYVSYQQIKGLYAVQNTTQTLYGDLDHPPPVPLPVRNNEDRYIVHDIHIMESDSNRAVSFPMKKWSHCFLTTDSRIFFPLLGNAVQDGNQLSLSWINETEYRIMKCYVYFNHCLFQIDPIEPLSKGEVHIPIPEQEETGLFQKHIETGLIHGEPMTPTVSLSETMRKILTKDIIVQFHTRYQSSSDILCLLGWIESDVISHEFIKPSSDEEGVVMLEWEIQVDTLLNKNPGQGNSALVIPKGDLSG